MEELYRVTRNYLVLLEPAYELADRAAQERMKKNGYITDLKGTAERMRLKIIEHRMFDLSMNDKNPTGLMIIEKKSEEQNAPKFSCPVSGTPLTKYVDCFFSEESLLAYPIIGNIPCLLPENAIIATQYRE